MKYLPAISFKIFALLLTGIFFGCQPAIITGKYKSYTPLLSTEIYTIGNTLIVRKDSSYTYTTCSSVSEGNWRVKGDSLYLYCSNFRYRIDSLNTSETRCQDTEAFRITRNKLLQRIKLKKIGYAYNALKKQD